MIIIVGIGNPDSNYKETRHNIGFTALEYIAKKCKIRLPDEQVESFKFEKKFNADIAKCKIGKKSTLLIKPQTFVNNTGDSVGKIKRFYKIKLEDILIIHDDLDIPFGKIKNSYDKNSGGHRGIESIIKSIKSKKFHRIRIGLANTAVKKARAQKSKKDKTEKIGKFVLSKFSTAEKKKLNQILKSVLERTELLLK